MKKGILIGLIVVVVLGVGGFFVFHKSSNKSPNSSSSSSTASNTSSQSSSTSSTSPNGQTDRFTINATDSGADKESVTVAKGTDVSMTFNVGTQGVYHGGLEFKSTDPPIDSGPIAQGSSKTVTFIASKSFSFQPYWYESSIKKDYLVTVNVD